MDWDEIVLDPGLLNEAAGVAPDDDVPVRLAPERPTSSTAGTRAWRLADALAEQSRATPPAWSSPLLVDSAAQLLASSALEAFRNSAPLEPIHGDRHDAHSATVHRAVAYIVSPLEATMSVVDIARAVQLAFRRHLDTTPTAYLRRVRLGRAHADLVTANPQGHHHRQRRHPLGLRQPRPLRRLPRRIDGMTPSETLGVPDIIVGPQHDP